MDKCKGAWQREIISTWDWMENKLDMNKTQNLAECLQVSFDDLQLKE
jgi:hypothetical protein